MSLLIINFLCNVLLLAEYVKSNEKLIKKIIMMQNNRLLIISFLTAVLLMIPLIAMQFTEDVNWTLFDFVVAGLLLFGTGMLCVVAASKIKKPQYRIAALLIIVTVLLIIWIELAVGIF